MVGVHLGRGLPHRSTRAFDQEVHLSHFIVHARQMTHRILEWKTGALAHELDYEISRRDCDPDIRRADRERRLRKHFRDAPALETCRCRTTSASGTNASF